MKPYFVMMTCIDGETLEPLYNKFTSRVEKFDTDIQALHTAQELLHKTIKYEGFEVFLS